MSENKKNVKITKSNKVAKSNNIANVTKTIKQSNKVIKSIKKQEITLRKHQEKAIKCIDKALDTNKSCLVKMFCGTGKSRIFFYKMIYDKKPLSVVVFPSIALVGQFNNDYIMNEEWSDLTQQYSYMSICSKDEVKDANISYTTEPSLIKKFINKKCDKIILVTYQSFATLANSIKETKIKIDLIIYDEAHHIIGDNIQNIIFNKKSPTDDYKFFEDKWVKSIYFTATPKNENGITMLERIHEDIDFEDIDFDQNDTEYDSEDSAESDNTSDNNDNNDYGEYKSDCGVLAFEYTHNEAVQDGICNDFNIAIDFSTDNTYKHQNVYSAISRCVFSTDNKKCLTFHYRSEKKHETRTHVADFTSNENIKKFKEEYNSVLKNEFPSKVDQYFNKLVVKGITSNTRNKKKILENLENDVSHVNVLSSCSTIGEGVDTKTFNMVCFVDPKSSHSTIIQNIGRICRKQDNDSTILIPCYVDATKYNNCKTDIERDSVIREEMNKDGNYTSILNVLSALRQDDQKLYNLCLNYPKSFAPKEISDNLRNQGYKIGPYIGDLNDTIAHLAQINDVDKYIISNIHDMGHKAFYLKKNIVIHSTSMENPIQEYNHNSKFETIMLYHNKNTDEYRPISVIDDSQSIRREIKGPTRKPIKINIHTNKDVKVLWKINDVFDFSSVICQVYISSTIIEDNWYETLEEVKKYMDKECKRPQSKSNEYYTMKKGIWLARQIINYKRKKGFVTDINKIGHWEDFLREYERYMVNSDAKWYDVLEKVKIYLDQRSMQLITNDKKLNRWITTQRKYYEQKKSLMIMPDKRLKWEEFTQKYSKYIMTKNEIWFNNLHKIEQFIKEKNRRPHEKTKCVEENILAEWLQEQLNKNAPYKKYPERKEKFEEFSKKYSNYIKTIDDMWYDSLNAVKIFIKDNGRRPNNKKKDESKLGRWITTNILNYNRKENAMRDPRKLEIWEQFTKEYHEYIMTDHERWFFILNMVKIFIKNNNVRPNIVSKDPNEKQLSCWISANGINYRLRRYGMKDIQKRKAFRDFVNDNAIFFDKSFLGSESDLENIEIDKNIQSNEEFIENPEKKYIVKSDDADIDDLDSKSNSEEIIEPIKSVKIHKSDTKNTKSAKSTNKKLIVQPKQKIEKQLIKRVDNKTIIQQTPKRIIKEIKPMINKEDEVVKINTRTSMKTTKQRKQPELSVLHKKYKTMSSINLHKEFESQPELWHEYHSIAEKSENGFSDEDRSFLPYNRIITYLSNLKYTRKKYIADLGCGKARIYEYFKDNDLFEFYNYDHISINDNIVSCDISKIPLEDHNINITILCLSMWGSNCSTYLDEANRILEDNGTLLIIEPKKRWTEEDGSNRLEKLVLDKGFQIKKQHKISNDADDKFMFLECIKL